MFRYYVWSNPNHSELLIDSICDLPPNMYCLLLFLICHDENQYLNLFKGQELEITISLYFVYFGVGAITLLGSLSYLVEEESDAPAVCAEWDRFHLLQLPRSEHRSVVGPLASVCSGLRKRLHQGLQHLVVTSLLKTWKWIISKEWKPPVADHEIWNLP